MFNREYPLYQNQQGGAKPKKNEQITVKEQLIYEGPFAEYAISVKVGDKNIKVVFNPKAKAEKAKAEKAKTEKAKAEKEKTEKAKTESEAKTADQDNPFGDAQPFDDAQPFGDGQRSWPQSQSPIGDASTQTKSGSSSNAITLDSGFPAYNFEHNAKSVEVNWYMSDRFDHELFKVFVKFFFGFDLLEVSKEYKEYILDERQDLEPIYRKNLYEQFEYFQNIFKLYSFEPPSSKQILTPVYQIDVYEIDNKIFSYKDLFNNIELTDNIICVQYETNVKCPIYWSLKTLTIYPNFGQSAFSLVYKQDGIVQTQIIQGNYLYVFSLTSDLVFDSSKQKPQKVIQIVPLQMDIKKFVKSYFEVQQHLQYDHSQFMMNFSDHFEIQKLSNTNYKIDFLSDIVVSIYTRYSTLFFSTISDDLDLVKKYFRICQNCGNFVQVQAISDLNTLQVISPLEFGNTQISNFEHQLESMKKRPSIIYDPSLKDSLASKDVYQEDDAIVSIQNTMSVQGYLIDGFRFFCNKSYPYLNFTRMDIEFQEDGQTYPLYYYKCQQMPIKATVQNIYRLYDIYRHFHLNDDFEKLLYNKIQGLIQEKPNLFLKYEAIIPGQYTILPQELYKIFPNTTFLLKLIMKKDKKISLAEYRQISDDAPWDNDWLASVANGQSIQIDNAVFYDIELKQYYVHGYQPEYDYLVLVYQQQFFTLITYQQQLGEIQLGRGKQSPAQTESDKQSSSNLMRGYDLHKLSFVFDKTINKFVEGYEFNDEFVQTKYLKKDVYITKQNNIIGIISPKQKISEPYTQKSTYDQVYLLNQDKDVIGYKQYNVYVYYKQPEKIDYANSYVLSNTIVKEDPSLSVDSNIDLSTSEVAAIIVFNNKSVLLEELPKATKQDVNKLYSKLHINVGKSQQLKLYHTKINYLTTVITEKQAKEAIEYILTTKPDSENLLESFIVNYVFDDQLYYNPRHETIKQISTYVQMQNVLRYRTVIQE